MKYEPLFELERTGIQIQYHTNVPAAYPVHWHSAIELIYILNGNAGIMIDGKEYTLSVGECIVIDSNKLHRMKYLRQSMMIVIYFSRGSMKNFVPLLDQYCFSCIKTTLTKGQVDSYLRVCSLLRGLAPLYVMQPVGYEIKSHAIAMEVFFELLSSMASQDGTIQKTEKAEALERLEEITSYIEEHHAEQLSLEQIASHFYLCREYFSRFFKKNMGVTFSRYLNQVRLMHVYQEICNTDAGIMALTEKHGFTNYKLFHKMFREVYGCTPREVRHRGSVEGRE